MQNQTTGEEYLITAKAAAQKWQPGTMANFFFCNGKIANLCVLIENSAKVMYGGRITRESGRKMFVVF